VRVASSFFVKWEDSERTFFTLFPIFPRKRRLASLKLFSYSCSETDDMNFLCNLSGRGRAECLQCEDSALWSRVARFFLVQAYQNGKNIPNCHKIYQIATKHNHKIYQIVTKYTKWQ
jgi:hypothetical protein